MGACVIGNGGRGWRRAQDVQCAVWYLVLLIYKLYSCGDVKTVLMEDWARLRGYEAAVFENRVEKTRGCYKLYATGYDLLLRVSVRKAGRQRLVLGILAMVNLRNVQRVSLNFISKRSPFKFFQHASLLALLENL